MESKRLEKISDHHPIVVSRCVRTRTGTIRTKPQDAERNLVTSYPESEPRNGFVCVFIKKGGGAGDERCYQKQQKTKDKR